MSDDATTIIERVPNVSAEMWGTFPRERQAALRVLWDMPHEATVEATLPTPGQIAMRNLARSLGYGDTAWDQIPVDVRARIEAAGAAADAAAQEIIAPPGTVDPIRAVAEWTRSHTTGLEHRAELVAEVYQPGILGAAQRHPVLTFAAGGGFGYLLSRLLSGGKTS